MLYILLAFLGRELNFLFVHPERLSQPRSLARK
nr:MAG TPA: hypothetical protein [Caudoviricetes sp.]